MSGKKEQSRQYKHLKEMEYLEKRNFLRFMLSENAKCK